MGTQCCDSEENTLRYIQTHGFQESFSRCTLGGNARSSPNTYALQPTSYVMFPILKAANYFHKNKKWKKFENKCKFLIDEHTEMQCLSQDSVARFRTGTCILYLLSPIPSASLKWATAPWPSSSCRSWNSDREAVSLTKELYLSRIPFYFKRKTGRTRVLGPMLKELIFRLIL